MSIVNLFLAVGLGFYRAFVFMVMFNWFVAEHFQFVEFNYWLSYALLMTISTLGISRGNVVASTHYETNQMKKEELQSTRILNISAIFLMLNIVLFVGWIIQLNIN